MYITPVELGQSSTKKQQRQDRKQEKRYYRKNAEYKSKSAINLQVDIPDSPNYYTMTVNLGTKKTPNTSITINETTTKNGTVTTTTNKSWIIDENFSNKYDFWVWLIFNQNRMAKARSIIKAKPLESVLTISNNLAAYAFKNDRKVLERILRPDNGIRYNWKDFDVTEPITKEEDEYYEIQSQAYLNAKVEYRATYQQTGSREEALKEAERTYFVTILRSDEKNPDLQKVHAALLREWRYRNLSRKQYKKIYGNKSYRNQKRTNNRNDKKWRRKRSEAFNNVVGPLTIGITRQYRTGREVYKVCNQQTLPKFKIDELEFIKAEKTFFYNAINNTNTKAYQYGRNNKLFQWRWKDLWALDPFWDVRKIIDGAYTEVFRAVLWSEHFFHASNIAIRDTLITYMVAKLLIIGYYNSYTPRAFKRMAKKAWKLSMQMTSLVEHIEDGKRIRSWQNQMNTFLDGHSGVKAELEELEQERYFKHQLYLHPELAKIYTNDRENFHGVHLKHVEYELIRDFKGVTAMTFFVCGYAFSIVLSIVVCFYDIYAFCTRLGKNPKKIIKPGAPERWWHNHDPFHDFFQDIKYVFKNIGPLLFASLFIKEEVDTIRGEVKWVKTIHDQHKLFPSPTQWLGIYIRHKLWTNSDFKLKVSSYIENELHLTALPKNWNRFILETMKRVVIVKGQVAKSSDSSDTFWQQAQRDVTKTIIYNKEDALINSHTHLANQVKQSEIWKNSENKDVIKAKNEVKTAHYDHFNSMLVWDNYDQLLHDRTYYVYHKRRVKHAFDHQLTIYVLSHMSNVELFPVKISKYMVRTTYDDFAAIAADYTLAHTLKKHIRLLKTNCALFSSSNRIKALLTSFKVVRWKHNHHIDLNYLFNPKNEVQNQITFGFDSYFLHGLDHQEQTKINKKISLNVNITYDLINAFQTKSVTQYYDKNGLYKTTRAILKADLWFRNQLEDLNKVVSEYAIDIFGAYGILAGMKGQKTVLKRYLKVYPNSLISHIAENKPLQIVSKVVSTEKALINYLNPRHLMTDLVLALIVRKVFYSPITFTDLDAISKFCEKGTDNGNERQRFYYELTHPLASGRKHCRLFYESALYWDVLITPLVRNKTKEQYETDKNSHEFRKYWSASRTRAQHGKTSLAGIYQNISNGHAILNVSLASFFEANYTAPVNKDNNIHGYYHYHRDIYHYNHRVNAFIFYKRSGHLYNKYWTQGKHFWGGETFRKWLYNGPLKGLNSFLNKYLGINTYEKLLSNKQIRTLWRISEEFDIPAQDIYKSLRDLCNGEDDGKIDSFLSRLKDDSAAQFEHIKTFAATFNLEPKKFRGFLRKAGMDLDSFIEKVGDDVNDVRTLKHKLEKWCETLSNDEKHLKEMLSGFIKYLDDSIEGKLGYMWDFLFRSAAPAVKSTEIALEIVNTEITDPDD